jgi:hypothetical protein
VTLVLITCIFVVIIFLIKFDLFINFLPSVAWITFMCIPYLFSYKYFSNVRIQAVGIFIYLCAFLVGDLIALRQSNRKQKVNISAFLIPAPVIIMLSILTLSIPIIHYFIVGDIPIYHLIFDNASLVDIQQNRFEYNRNSTPYFFALLSNYLITIVGPILIVFLFAKKSFLQSIIVFIWLAIYSISSGAKLYFVYLVFVVLLICSQTIWVRFRKLLSLFIASIFLFIALSGIFLGTLALSKSNQCPIPVGANLTPANILRSCSQGEEISLNPISNTLGYRVFLTPVEVSNNWYNFFGTDLRPKNTLSDLLNRQNELKPSNIIGNYYYSKYWPDKYSKSINANSSIDSEAYSYGGIPLIIIFSFIIVYFRYLVSLKSLANNSITAAIEGIGITYLTISPISSSLPAIVIPQGFWLLLILIFLNRFRLLPK